MRPSIEISLSLEESRHASHREWEAMWRICPYATYYHSPEWSILWDEYTLGRMHPAPVWIRFSDGASAIVPVSWHVLSGGVVRRYISSVPQDVTYGGGISGSKLSTEHRALLVRYLRSQYPNLLWRLNPYDESLSEFNPGTMMHSTTHVLRLEDGIDTLFKRFSKGHRNAVKQARAADVTIRRGNSIEDWGAYFALYKDSIRRWGKSAFSVQSWRLFELIHHMRSPDIGLWLAECNGMAIAGRIIVYSNNHAISWHGSALEESLPLRPVNLLHYELIRDSVEKGYDWYDFGPSGNLQGVRRFKEHFGTRELPCNKVRFMTPIVSLGRKVAQFVNSVY